MKLMELNPYFVDRKTDSEYTMVSTPGDGITFLCPKCFLKNGGARGTHSITCWQPHVPQTTYPIPGRWNFIGTGYNDLTLKNGSSSIALTTGCKAHFYIQNGEITFA